MPPAPVGQPPPEFSLAGVVLPQAARRVDMLESESAAPPDRRRKSRRVVARRRSFGCMSFPPKPTAQSSQGRAPSVARPSHLLARSLLLLLQSQVAREHGPDLFASPLERHLRIPEQ